MPFNEKVKKKLKSFQEKSRKNALSIQGELEIFRKNGVIKLKFEKYERRQLYPRMNHLSNLNFTV